jgi:hypothetical protein
LAAELERRENMTERMEVGRVEKALEIEKYDRS